MPLPTRMRPENPTRAAVRNYMGDTAHRVDGSGGAGSAMETVVDGIRFSRSAFQETSLRVRRAGGAMRHWASQVYESRCPLSDSGRSLIRAPTLVRLLGRGLRRT